MNSSTNDGMRAAGEDPVRNAVPGQEVVYETIQRLWSAWARHRYRDDLERIAAFALFIGYPRSGHSIVGAMLNAHRHAVISHELDVCRLILAGSDRNVITSRILSRAAWFNLRGNTSNYRYQVPNPWQGRFEKLHLVGDKGGGWAAQWLGRHPDLLSRIRRTMGVPLRLIHVVRNPWDNIAAISLWHRLSLDDSIDFYFAHCETTGNLQTLTDPQEVITLRHEDFIEAPVTTLTALCTFLNLDVDDAYVAECTSIVFARPTGTRRRVTWSAAQVAAVGQRAARHAFLDGYEFDMESGRAPNASDAPFTRAREVEAGGAHRHIPSAVGRFGAWLNPRVSRRLGATPEPAPRA